MKAKKKRTRLWSILLVLVMVVGMLPTTALATVSNTADFTTGDGSAALALLNAAKTDGAADSTWDGSTNTLTLNGVNFETSTPTAVKLPDGAIIVLSDGTTNTIKGGLGSEDCFGIYGEGSLTIQGNGTLNVTSGTAGKLSFGIHAKDSVTIKSGAVTATGGAAPNNQSFGIRTLDGDLFINGGKVKAKGGEAKVSSNGLWAGNGSVNISGGEVEAESGRVTGIGASSGIYAVNVEISNTGTIVTATGGNFTAGVGTSYGINAGTVTFSGGTLTAATKGDWCIKGNSSVTASGVKTISFDSNGGKGTMMAKTTKGEYTLPANGFTPPAGMQLKGWATSANGTVITGSTINVSANTTLYAIWEDIPATEYTITVTDGTASVSESTVNKAAEGTTVTLTANAAPSGKVFDKWVVVSGSTEITLANANSAKTTFIMPAGAVSVKATYKSAPTIGGYIPPVQKPIVKNDDNVTTSADLKEITSTKGGTTTVNVDKAIGEEIVDKAVANESKEIVIDANAKNTAAAASTVIAQISIPTDTLAAIAEKTEADVTVKNDVAKVKFDNTAAGAAAQQAVGDTVQIIVGKVAETAVKVEYQLKVVCSAGNVISDFQGGNVAVTVAIPKEMEEKKVVCVYIDDNGRMSKVKGQKNEDGTYTFTTGHFSTYVLMPEADADKVIKDQAISAVKSIKSTVTLSTKSVKRGIKVSVKIPASQKADKTGIIIYRATKKSSRYAMYKKVKTSGSTYTITNTLNVKGNRLVKGKRYYYKARVYKVIDGKTYYGPMSNIKYMRAK